MPSLVLNGQPVDFALDPQTPLLWALRDVANLTGTKYGCGTGDCGACLVLADGEPLPACTLSLAEAEGRSVTTIEGLAQRTGGAARHPVIQALIDEQAIQCGVYPRLLGAVRRVTGPVETASPPAAAPTSPASGEVRAGEVGPGQVGPGD